MFGLRDGPHEGVIELRWRLNDMGVVGTDREGRGHRRHGFVDRTEKRVVVDEVVQETGARGGHGRG